MNAANKKVENSNATMQIFGIELKKKSANKIKFKLL